MLDNQVCLCALSNPCASQAVCRLFAELRAYYDAAQHAEPFAWGQPGGSAERGAKGSGPAQDPAALALLLHERLGAVPREAGRAPPGAAGALVDDVRAAAPSLPQARALQGGWVLRLLQHGKRVCVAGISPSRLACRRALCTPPRPCCRRSYRPRRCFDALHCTALQSSLPKLAFKAGWQEMLGAVLARPCCNTRVAV